MRLFFVNNSNSTNHFRFDFAKNPVVGIGIGKSWNNLVSSSHTTYSWNIMFKNGRAIVVCGFLMKYFKNKYAESLKKIVGAVWELPAK